MTLKQLHKLEDIGFDFKKCHTVKVFYDTPYGSSDMEMTRAEAIQQFSEEDYIGLPTAEEMIEWVAGKLTEKGFIINFLISKSFISATIINAITNKKHFVEIFDTLSEAVYALAVWAHKNKLLEA